VGVVSGQEKETEKAFIKDTAVLLSYCEYRQARI